MPTTPFALFCFVWLTVPGLVYILQRRRMAQVRFESAFVETARIALVSVITDSLAIGVLELVRLFDRSGTPNLRYLLIDHWRRQISNHWALDIWWAIVVLTIASFAAYLMAKWGEKFIPLVVGQSANSPYNAWWKYFHDEAENNLVFVALDLSDGRYVQGYVDWCSSEVNDVGDRDLVIQQPKERIGDTLISLNSTYMIISARNISRIHLTYIQS